VPAAAAFVYLVPFGLLAMVLVYMLYVAIGLTAFWIGDVSPLFWIAQKLLFIFGGLMLPLSLYPGWMQRVAYATPFPSMLAGPAGFMVGDGAHVGWLARGLGLWSVALTLLVYVLYHLAARRLQVNGG
jgi:ABC-2 type transport system permease protein